jgi:hypothetical protein
LKTIRVPSGSLTNVPGIRNSNLEQEDMLGTSLKSEKLRVEATKNRLLTQLHESTKQINKSSLMMKQIISSSAQEFRFDLAPQMSAQLALTSGPLIILEIRLSMQGATCGSWTTIEEQSFACSSKMEVKPREFDPIK